MPESSFSTPLMQLNIKAARKHFEELEKIVDEPSVPVSRAR